MIPDNQSRILVLVLDCIANKQRFLDNPGFWTDNPVLSLTIQDYQFKNLVLRGSSRFIANNQGFSVNVAENLDFQLIIQVYLNFFDKS